MDKVTLLTFIDKARRCLYNVLSIHKGNSNGIFNQIFIDKGTLLKYNISQKCHIIIDVYFVPKWMRDILVEFIISVLECHQCNID